MRQRRLRRTLEHPFRTHRNPYGMQHWKYGVYHAGRYAVVRRVLDSEDFTRDFMPRWVPRRFLHYGVRGPVGRPRGVEHDRMRRAAARVVSPAVFRQMRPTYRQLAHELIGSVSRPGTKADFRQVAQKMTYNSACLTFGLEELMTDELRQWFFGVLEKFGGSSPFYTYAQKGVRERFRRITLERMKHPQGKPIDTILASEELPLEEKIILVFFMLLSAVITTTEALLAAMVALKAHNTPKQLAEHCRRVLSGDEDLLRRLERETVRLYPPNIARPFRVVSNHAVLDGEHMPKGRYIMASWCAADCDEEYFPDPLAFDTERPSTPIILGFSEGSDYSCVGKPYSEEIFIAFHTALATILPRMVVKKFKMKGKLALSVERMIVRVR
jgi:cytochrome P450